MRLNLLIGWLGGLLGFFSSIGLELILYGDGTRESTLVVERNGFFELISEEGWGEGDKSDANKSVYIGRLAEVSDLEHQGVSLDFVPGEDDLVRPFRVHLIVRVDGCRDLLVPESHDDQGFHLGEDSTEVSLEGSCFRPDIELSCGVDGENLRVVLAGSVKLKRERKVEYSHLLAIAVEVTFLVKLKVPSLSDLCERESSLGDKGVFENILVPDFNMDVVVLLSSFELDFLIPDGELPTIFVGFSLLELSPESKLAVRVLFPYKLSVLMNCCIFDDYIKDSSPDILIYFEVICIN